MLNCKNYFHFTIHKMHILVTGGCGFIGSNLVEYFLENNLFSEITILDNLSTGKIENISELLKNNKNLHFIEGDINNLNTCKEAVKNINVICHQAALASVPASLEDPIKYNEINVTGFINLLFAAKERGIKRFVYATSSAVYGDDETPNKIEDITGNLLSPYAANKKINEIYAQTFTSCYNMECIGLRYFNVFGPKQDPNGQYAAVIPKFIINILNNKQSTINGDGSFTRDFAFIDNIIQANYKALTTTNPKCFGQTFNIGLGKKTSILELHTKLCQLIGKNIEPIFGEFRNGDIAHSNANINKSIGLLNYEPNYNLNNGLQKTIDFFRKSV